MTGMVDRRSLLVAAGGVVIASGSLGHAAPAMAQVATSEKRNFAGARLATKYRFDDPDMDLFFVIALGWGAAGGLSIGEAFYIASTIEDGDADSWVASFDAAGDRELKQAEEWKAAGMTLQSAQARLKAFAAYRSAWQFAPIGPVFDGLYAKHQAAFRAALPELGLPATFFDAPYKGRTLPGVFIQNPDKRAPVVLLLGGGDTCFEEIYFTVGRHVYESGYSVALADLPGQGITMKDGYHWEAEPEKPIAAVVDLLVERFGAKPGRMAMLGYSLGGYFATRAAGHEKRFATVMASTPLPRPELAFASAAGGDKKTEGEAVKSSSVSVRNLQIMCWKAGATDTKEMVAKLTHFVADPALVTMPFLSVVGTGEGSAFQTDSDWWNENIRSTRKKLVRLDASTGGDAHVQAANRLRLAQEMAIWMDSIFDIRG